MTGAAYKVFDIIYNVMHMNTNRIIYQHIAKQITNGKIKVVFVPDRGPGHKMKGVDY